MTLVKQREQAILAKRKAEVINKAMAVAESKNKTI